MSGSFDSAAAAELVAAIASALQQYGETPQQLRAHCWCVSCTARWQAKQPVQEPQQPAAECDFAGI